MPHIAGRFYVPVDGLLTAEECTAFIRDMDRADNLRAVDSAIAAYDRGVLVSDVWAERLWQRVRPLMPADIAAVAHCNTHIRFSKYHPGQCFEVHRDGLNQDARGYRTKFTVNIFLNDGFQGGETDFLDESRNDRCIGQDGPHLVSLSESRVLVYRAMPAPGRGMVFDREILHRGNMVQGGYKYLLRTDVMVPAGME
jgi:hypothetical protein